MFSNYFLLFCLIIGINSCFINGEMVKRPSWAVGRDVDKELDSVESYEDYNSGLQKRPSWVTGRGLDKRIIEFKRSFKEKSDAEMIDLINSLTRRIKDKDRKASKLRF